MVGLYVALALIVLAYVGAVTWLLINYWRKDRY